MAWSASKIFSALITDVLNNTTAIDLNTDASLKVALYDNDITPDQTVTSANTAYNVGQWVTTGNEVSDGAEWAVGGVALTTYSPGDGVTRYRLGTSYDGLTHDYFGDHALCTALGAAEALVMLRAYIAGASL